MEYILVCHMEMLRNVSFQHNAVTHFVLKTILLEQLLIKSNARFGMKTII